MVRGLAVSGAAIASVASIVMTQAPAFADPGVTYVAVGSDTIQDFWNGYAAQVGNSVFGSYNATNPADNATVHQVITPVKNGITTSATAIAPENCSFNRPNGSGEGSTALTDSLGLTTTNIAGEVVSGVTLPGNTPQANCVDIARSSNGPGAVDQTAGKIQFIPFALDAVTAAVGPSAPVTIENAAGTGTESAGPTNLGAVATTGFSKTSLQAMFGLGNDAVLNGATSPATCYAPFQGPDAVPPGFTCSSTVTVDLYVPQSGSGTLKFWAAQMGFNPAVGSVPNWDHQTIVNGAGTTLSDYATASPAAQVEEHDGTAFAADPNGIGPFSIAQWIAQNNGINPRFHGAQLTQVNGVAPTNGAAPGTLNTTFPIVRQVYNAFAYDRVTSGVDNFFDPILAQAFVGSGSALCQDTLLINHYGFGKLTTTDSPNQTACGSTATIYRADS